MKTTYLNIHNFLTAQINQPYKPDFVKDIDQPLSYFEVTYVAAPDIILNIGDFKPANDNCAIVDYKYHIKHDYIYCSELIQKIPFKVEIRGLLDGPTVINVRAKARGPRQIIFPAALPQNIFLKPIIDFKLLQQQVLSVHAGAVACDKGAIILVGRGGTFKTTLSMDLVRKNNYKFLADDRILISKDTAFCYPIHHRLFDFRISRMKTENYHAFDKFKFVLYQLGSPSANGCLCKSAPLFKVICVTKGESGQFKSGRIARSNLIKKIVTSQILENTGTPSLLGISDGKLYEYLAAYSFIFPDSKAASYWDDYGKLAEKTFADSDFATVSLPPAYTPDLYTRLLNSVAV